MLAVLTYLCFAVCGIAWGAREYFHKDPLVFERLWNVDKWGFWGSLGWIRKYKDYPGDQRPRNWIIGFFPYNDFWHLAWYICLAFYTAGVILAGEVREEWYLIAGVSISTHVLHASLAFRIIDKKREQKTSQ